MNPPGNFNFHLSSPVAPQHLPGNQTSHPGPGTSPSQSVPGRRTPLGTVGIGGFYAQSGLMATATHSQTDENQPSGSREELVNMLPRDRYFIFLFFSICYLQTISEYVEPSSRTKHTW